MSKCSVCKNEKVLCVCPKSLGGGAGEAKDTQKDEAYDKSITQIANALLTQYFDIFKNKRHKVPEFINHLRTILNSKSAETLISLLNDGIATTADQTAFTERFKSLNPNMAMLDAISHKFNLGVFPSPANQLVAGIKQKLQLPEFGNWPSYPDINGGSFQDALSIYAAYYEKLSPQNQKTLSVIFWEQIHNLGTPIIESNPAKPTECSVYFLLPKYKLFESKDLYLQGDFHGYDTIDDRQRVEEFRGTGIMYNKRSITRDAVVTYRYIKLEPGLREKIPFWDASSQLVDEHSRHRPPFLVERDPEKVFRVSAEPTNALIPAGTPVDWSRLLSTAESKQQKSNRFVFHNTLYADLQGKLQQCAGDIKRDAPPDDLFSKASYANLTRAVHVFKPHSGMIDQVVFVNDGTGYLISGAMEQFENNTQLSANTAFVFVTSLPGLAKTNPVDDPKAKNPGMGVRTIEYEHGITVYIKFIESELLRGVDGLIFPQDPNRRLMIGSSLSGTASIYIALNHPELFGAVIAQSPSESNSAILNDAIIAVSPSKPRAEIHLSCGIFEQPAFAGNTNLPYARELSSKLNIHLEVGLHGHLFLAWVQDLQKSLPETISKLHGHKPVDVLESSRRTL